VLLLQDGAGEAALRELQEGRSWVEQMVDWARDYAPAVLGALLTFLIGRWLAQFGAGLLRRIFAARHIDPTLSGFLCNLAYTAALTLVIVAAVGKLGVETTSFVAILGAATLALGFALQSTLGDVSSGVMLIFFRPFSVGDTVETGGGSGIVEEIGIFATHMRTADNKTIIIPNSKITGNTITNYSAKATRRVDLVVGVGYRDDLRLAKEVLLEVCQADERILDTPPTEVGVAALGESSVDLYCRPWVKIADHAAVTADLLERIKLAFDGRGISIPCPQRDVRLFQTSA
jgi:small conductance mechanosensitive channel